MSCSSADDQKRMKTMALDDLPHDVVVEILARLPKKSLARFNCVSREWKHTLSHGWFQDLRRDCKRSKRRRQPKWIMRMSQRRVRGCWELCCQQMTHTEEQAAAAATKTSHPTCTTFKRIRSSSYQRPLTTPAASPTLYMVLDIHQRATNIKSCACTGPRQTPP